MEKEVKYIEKADIDIEKKERNAYLTRKNNHRVSVNVDKIALDCENACNDIWYNLNKDTCIRKVEKARSTKKAYKELEKVRANVLGSVLNGIKGDKVYYYSEDKKLKGKS